MIFLVIWNIAVFVIYGIDKYCAINGMWRISEKTLLLLAFLMGGTGAFCGMQFFRHKTKHMKFNVCVPIAVFLNIAVIYFIWKEWL